MRDGRGDASWVAERLLRLHAVTPPPGTGLRTRADDLWRIRSGLRGMVARCPSLDRQAQSIGRLLGTRVLLGLSATRYRLIHGDLHAKNVLVDDNTLWFVDLERVTVGPSGARPRHPARRRPGEDIHRPGWPPHAVAFAERLSRRFGRRRSAVNMSTTASWPGTPR
ncbi:MAG: aminoglycoside phosphotransferase family protein [Acidimicrobiia bacterium]|nr:aminoglycoside phosphotransferase family protein [Acidimicrobiia bacterium]